MSRDQAIKRAIHLTAVRQALHVAVVKDCGKFKPEFSVVEERDHHYRCRHWPNYMGGHRVIWPREE